MEFKKEVIEQLEAELKEKTLKYFNNEYMLRALKSVVLVNPHDKDLLAAETASFKAKEALKNQINKIREVLKDVKDGKIVV